MNKDSLGKLVVNEGKLYEVVAYIENPCLELEERATGIRKVVVIGSRESINYKELEDYIKELGWLLEEKKKGSD